MATVIRNVNIIKVRRVERNGIYDMQSVKMINTQHKTHCFTK
jgi:hypothetical protein